MRKLSVLFLCTGNSCRSVMGEALLRRAAGAQIDVHSAGTNPKGVNPLTVQVLQEIGIDTSGLRSKSAAEFVGRGTFDYVITVCHDAEETCPRLWPELTRGAGISERQFWPFEDPPAHPGSDAERLNKFREVRDQIDARVRQWVAELETRGVVAQLPRA